MKKYLIGIYAFCLLASCTAPEEKTKMAIPTLPSGDYFGQVADTSAQIFAEGIVSKAYQELNAVFSPDGQAFYYTLADAGRSFYVIMYYKRNSKGEWEGPQVAPFSGQYSDADPFITSDGKRLYFISRRPVDASSTASKDFDIWVCNKTAEGWSEPTNLGAPINTPANEFYVSVTDGGSIFYSAQYEGGVGRSDIYEAKPTGETYEVVNLGPNVNSPTGEGDPYVSPDGNMIVFMSWGRPEDLGGGDLYISFKKDGDWQPAVNLGPQINSNAFEYCPMLSPDGKYFFWTSYRSSPLQKEDKPWDYANYTDRLESSDNGLGNVYWIDASVLDQFR